MGINAGDQLDISGTMPKGSFPFSQYDIAGVSGVGQVIETGDGVPAGYKGKWVTVYRSLQFGDQLVGTWSEYGHLHFLQCVVLPDNVNPDAYAGSLVNIITSYAFWQQVRQEGHQGVINTAGNSATGIAMIGMGQALGFPVISLVRNESGRHELEALGAQNILVQEDKDYKEKLQASSAQLKTTAVFDGVGGAVLTQIMDVLPAGSAIYAYGFLGGQTPVTFPTSLLLKGISLRGFGNFRTATVQDPQKLAVALEEIGKIIHLPHFRTKIGQEFRLEQIVEALRYTSSNGGKAILKIV